MYTKDIGCRDETEGQSEIIIVLEGLSSHLAKKGMSLPYTNLTVKKWMKK